MLTQFGGDPHSWDIGEGGTGDVGIGLFANAVSVFVGLQDRKVTVDEVAVAFNATPAVVRQAVEWHPWMFLAGDAIEHDGE